MATDSQRRMLIRPLMKRRPDLAYHRQYILIRPLTHYLRGVYFCPGRHTNDVQLANIMMPLFEGSHDLWLTHNKAPSFHGRFPFHYYHRDDWQEDPEGTSRKVCDLIENEALPELAGLTTPEAVAGQPGYGSGLEGEILDPCFNGDYDEAERVADAYVEYWRGRVEKPGAEPSITRVGGKITRIQPVYEYFSTDQVTEEHKFSDVRQWRMTYLAKLLKTDRSRIPALLHDWEEFTVNAFKLNKYWTRTPFPCEG